MNVHFDPFERCTFWQHRGCCVIAWDTMFPYYPSHQRLKTACTACRDVDVGHLQIGKTCNGLVVYDNMCKDYVSYVSMEV